MRPLLLWPDARLTQPAGDVAEITDDIRAIWQEMIAVMEAMPGVGLAAPQLGVPLRLAVVDASDARGFAIRMANPELLELSGPVSSYPEASPNLPGVSAPVWRQEACLVRYLDETGQEKEQEFSGLWGRSVQHQIDHHHGMLYIDRLSRVKRDMILRRFSKR